MPKLALVAAAMLLSLGLQGCGGDSGSGPAEVRWDRFICDRCRMVLSDRVHSAQVRYPEGEQRTRVAFFDDIGCAMIWLEDKPFKDDPRLEIWVTDWRSGDWIDARTATYLPGQVTPMEYGLGAQPEPTAGGFDYNQARDHVFEVERRFNVHGGHLEQAAGERK